MFSLIITIVLNLVPGGVDTLTVEGLGDEKLIRCTRQADGRWQMTDDAGKESMTFLVKGTKLTAKPTTNGSPPPPQSSGNAAAGHPDSTNRRYASR